MPNLLSPRDLVSRPDNMDRPTKLYHTYITLKVHYFGYAKICIISLKLNQMGLNYSTEMPPQARCRMGGKLCKRSDQNADLA